MIIWCHVHVLMPVVQATLSFVVELREFHNVDLYHRGYYQIRTYLKTNGQPSTNTGSTYVKSTAFVEPPLLWERASTRFKVPEAVKASYIEPSVSVPTYIPEKACSKTLLIMYRDETAKICDVFEQRVLIQVDPINLEDSLMRNDLFLCIELWFVEDPLDKPFSPGLLTKVCERQLRIHITPSRGLHYHFTVFFDYFHLCAIELALYGALTNISSNIISWPKISPHNTPLQANSPIVNLAQQTWHSILCNVKQVSRYHFALAMHRHICQVLLAARESMLLFWRESIPYLPANVKPRIEAVDFRSKLDSLTEMTQALETDDDLANQISFDVARLSSQNTVLFKQLCKSVTLQSNLASFLRRRFHQIRMKRFAEAFFCQELSLANLLAVYDSNGSGHESLASDVRQSLYFQKLPTLPVTCRELDGDLTNLPIIFEDIFLPLNVVETKPFSALSQPMNGYHATSNLMNKICEHPSTTKSVEVVYCNNQPSSVGDSSTHTTQRNRSDDNESGIYLEDEVTSSQTSKYKSIDLSRRDTVPCEDKKAKCAAPSNYVYASSAPNLLAYQVHDAISRSSPNLASSMAVRQLPTPIRTLCKPPPSAVTPPPTNHFNSGQSKRRFYPPGSHGRKFFYFDKSRGSTASSLLNSDGSKVKLVGYRSIRPLDNHVDQDSGLFDSRSRLTGSSLNLPSDVNHCSTAPVRRPCLAIRDIRSRSLNNLSDQFSWSKCRRRVRVRNLKKNHPFSVRRLQCNQLKTYNADLAYLGSCSDLQLTALEDEFKASHFARSRNHSLKVVPYPSITTGCWSQEKKRLAKSTTMLSTKEESTMDMQSISSSSLSTTDIFDYAQRNNASRYSLSYCWPMRGPSHQCIADRNHRRSVFGLKVLEDSLSTVTYNSDGKSFTVTTVTTSTAPVSTATSIKDRYQRPKSLTIGGNHSASGNGTSPHGYMHIYNSGVPFVHCSDKRPNHLISTDGGSNTNGFGNKRSTSSSSDCSHPSSAQLEEEEGMQTTHSNNRLPLSIDSAHDNRLNECGYQIPDLLSSDDEVTSKNSPKLTVLEMLNNELGRNAGKISSINYSGRNRNHMSTQSLTHQKSPNNSIYLAHSSSLPYKEKNGYRNTLNGGHLDNDGSQSLVDILSPGVMEFLRLKEKVKRDIAPHFQGHVYSDFATLAAPYAYFSEAPVFNEDVHLIVCVHGLDGNSCDLRLVRVYLQLALPDCHLQFLMSECNQQDTFGGFDIMSEKLVREITDYIDEMDDEPKRISFIGHSMGCVIIRAALLDPRMKPYLSKLHTFLSLSGPHLGTVYNSSGLINMGIWVMQKIKKSESLSQLRMRDDPDLRNTYLYRLSTSPGLDLFRYVLLVGSPQDRYVPYHSTRIELCKAAIRDPSTLGVIYMEMVTNLLQRLIKSTRTAVVRYDVHYSLTNSANTLIGRAAHIAVLDSEIFLEKFISTISYAIDLAVNSFLHSYT
ncbi:unnamed protein product [Heterobilharzia americana]|nr:unnamed protein product [Heterobilharzia americana]